MSAAGNSISKWARGPSCQDLRWASSKAWVACCCCCPDGASQYGRPPVTVRSCDGPTAAVPSVTPTAKLQHSYISANTPTPKQHTRKPQPQNNPLSQKQQTHQSRYTPPSPPGHSPTPQTQTFHTTTTTHTHTHADRLMQTLIKTTRFSKRKNTVPISEKRFPWWTSEQMLENLILTVLWIIFFFI